MGQSRLLPRPFSHRTYERTSYATPKKSSSFELRFVASVAVVVAFALFFLFFSPLSVAASGNAKLCGRTDGRTDGRGRAHSLRHCGIEQSTRCVVRSVRPSSVRVRSLPVLFCSLLSSALRAVLYSNSAHFSAHHHPGRFTRRDFLPASSVPPHSPYPSSDEFREIKMNAAGYVRHATRGDETWFSTNQVLARNVPR